jgi:MFS family permease
MLYQQRGWGVGVVGGISSLGAGITLLLNAFVGNQPWSWRFLYGVCALQIPLAWFILKHVPESKMFLDLKSTTGSGKVDTDATDAFFSSTEEDSCEDVQRSKFGSERTEPLYADQSRVKELRNRRGSVSEYVQVRLCGDTSILRKLVTAYPARLLACTAVSILLGMAFAPSSMYKVKYMEEVHGFTPAQVRLYVVSLAFMCLILA